MGVTLRFHQGLLKSIGHSIAQKVSCNENATTEQAGISDYPDCTPPVKNLKRRIPIMIPIKGRGFVYHGPGLGFRVCCVSIPLPTNI